MSEKKEQAGTAMGQGVHIVLASTSPRRKRILRDAGVRFDVVAPQVDEHLTQEQAADPVKAAQTLAERKAGGAMQVLLADQGLRGQFAVLAADTMVVLDGRVFGKPHGFSEAKGMLRALSGRTHQVVTGVSVWMLVVTGENPDGTGDSDAKSAKAAAAAGAEEASGSATTADAADSDAEGQDAPADTRKVSLGHRTFACTSDVTFKKLTDEQINDYLAKGESYDKAGAYAIQGAGCELVERLDGDFDNVVGLPIGRVQKEFPGLFG